jgi:hypothetical protein
MVDLTYRIRDRAQQIWENEGRPEGRADEHWKEAERQLASEVHSAAARVGSGLEPADEQAEHQTAVETEPGSSHNSACLSADGIEMHDEPGSAMTASAAARIADAFDAQRDDIGLKRDVDPDLEGDAPHAAESSADYPAGASWREAEQPTAGVPQAVADGDTPEAGGSGDFDESWYLAHYQDVAEAVRVGVIGSAHQHYAAIGQTEGRLPRAPVGFDEEWYLYRYPDVADAVDAGRIVSGLKHFIAVGFAEGRVPNKAAEEQS